MGFKSGLLDGQSMTLILFSLQNSVAIRDVCLGHYLVIAPISWVFKMFTKKGPSIVSVKQNKKVLPFKKKFHNFLA